MNKRRVDDLIPKAYDLCRTYEINIKYRNHIASFGSAVTTGSLLAAVAFFSNQRKASLDRSKLMAVINEMLKCHQNTLFDTVRMANNTSALKEEIIDCAIAIKLALNLIPAEGGGNE